MKQTMRRYRMLWLLAAVTVTYGLLNAAIFFTTGQFNTAWFVTSLAVYGALAAATLWLLFVDRSLMVASASAEPEIVSQQVIYETRTGQALRVARASSRESKLQYYGITSLGVQSLTDLEARLDAVELKTPPQSIDSRVDEAIERRARPTSLSSSESSTVSRVEWKVTA